MTNHEYVVAKQYIFDEPSSVETLTVRMLYPDAVLQGDSEFDTFAANNNVEFPGQVKMWHNSEENEN